MDWLLVNPLSGGGRSRDRLAAVRARLKEHAVVCEEHEAETMLEIQDIAAKAVKAHASRLWVLGGDGSLSAAAAALCYSETLLCPLPGGTAGVFCRELAIPSDPRDAVTALLEGDSIAADMGRILSANGSDIKFLLMASVGLDAKAVRDVSLSLKSAIGGGAYGLSMLWKFLSSDISRLTVTDDHGIDQIGYHLFVQNTRLYAGPFEIAPKARLDDGRFDVILLKHPSRLAAARFFLGVLTGRHMDQPDVEYFRSTRIKVRSDEPEAVQADGDCVGLLPVEISILPKALRILGPARAAAGFA